MITSIRIKVIGLLFTSLAAITCVRKIQRQGEKRKVEAFGVILNFSTDVNFFKFCISGGFGRCTDPCVGARKALFSSFGSKCLKTESLTMRSEQT